MRERENEKIRIELETEFKKVDVNHDGYITKDELRDFLVNRVSEVEGPSTQNVNLQEYDRLVARIFEEMDKDKDAAVALNEFIENYWISHLNLQTDIEDLRRSIQDIETQSEQIKASIGQTQASEI